MEGPVTSPHAPLGATAPDALPEPGHVALGDDLAISVEGLGKCYRIYDRPQDRLKQALRLRGQHYREFWALKDVVLEVRRGETVGIVGRNGSGKSTLLQLVCGILNPSRGTLKVHGRVAALLELGTGFNPDFTGRENVFMNGAILGLDRAEIEARYDEIVAFSELERFVDQPVKTYSSGMFVRLAFAVATACEPDILIVDEALAVGDEAFQRKCFSRIERLRERGGTILFVSHAASTVVQLCNRAFLLDQGEVLLSGPPRRVITAYQKLAHAPPDRVPLLREQLKRGCDSSGVSKPSVVSGTVPADKSDAPLQASYDPHLQSKSCVEYESQGARISRARITTLAGEPANQLLPREDYVLQYQVQFEKSCFQVRFGTMIKSVSGNELGGYATAKEDCEHVAAGTTVEVRIRFRCLLPAGTYFINVGLRGTPDQEEVFLHRYVDLLVFRVLPEATDGVQGMFDFLMNTRVDYRQLDSEKAA